MIRFSPNLNRANLIRWFEWGPEAFQEAERLDRPVMLFLGAFWCGLCQRMDEMAFSNDENIALLNAYFIPVRAENAQRPDVDIRYSQNGWPTIAFLTPQGDHIASVNYLPAADFGNALARIYAFYRDHKEAVEEAVARAYQEALPKGAREGGNVPISAPALEQISGLIMDLADPVHGGYGRDNKFPHTEANDFLLDRFETTHDRHYLGHVLLTLDRMWKGRIHDQQEGGFFRYSSKADWSEPHREKLLSDQAGILGNCLRVSSMTQHLIYRQMAEEIINYLNTKLSDPSGVVFYGCEDFVGSVRRDDDSQPEASGAKPGNPRSVVDHWVYTDANAQTISAYLQASSVLGRPDCRERALRVLSFLWDRCRESEGGMVHYFDGSPRVSGLLMDQVHMGLALLKAYEITADVTHFDRAKELAKIILENFSNPDGGYYDLCALGPAHLRFRLTMLEHSGAAASFFLDLYEATREQRYREAALWALSAFTEDFTSYGIHAAGFGRALSHYIYSRG